MKRSTRSTVVRLANHLKLHPCAGVTCVHGFLQGVRASGRGPQKDRKQGGRQQQREQLEECAEREPGHRHSLHRVRIVSPTNLLMFSQLTRINITCFSAGAKSAHGQEPVLRAALRSSIYKQTSPYLASMS